MTDRKIVLAKGTKILKYDRVYACGAKDAYLYIKNMEKYGSVENIAKKTGLHFEKIDKILKYKKGDVPMATSAIDNEYLEVFFDKYCKQCKHKDKKECESPCDGCLEEYVNLYSHKPVKFEESN